MKYYLPSTTHAVLTWLVICVISSMNLVCGDEWTDSTGSYRVEAQFIGVKGTSVLLRKLDGAVISVPISRLGEESRRRAKQLFENMRSTIKEISVDGYSEQDMATIDLIRGKKAFEAGEYRLASSCLKRALLYHSNQQPPARQQGTESKDLTSPEGAEVSEVYHWLSLVFATAPLDDLRNPQHARLLAGQSVLYPRWEAWVAMSYALAANNEHELISKVGLQAKAIYFLMRIDNPDAGKRTLTDATAEKLHQELWAILYKINELEDNTSQYVQSRPQVTHKSASVAKGQPFHLANVESNGRLEIRTEDGESSTINVAMLDRSMIEYISGLLEVGEQPVEYRKRLVQRATNFYNRWNGVEANDEDFLPMLDSFYALQFGFDLDLVSAQSNDQSIAERIDEAMASPESVTGAQEEGITGADAKPPRKKRTQVARHTLSFEFLDLGKNHRAKLVSSVSFMDLRSWVKFTDLVGRVEYRDLEPGKYSLWLDNERQVWTGVLEKDMKVRISPR